MEEVRLGIIGCGGMARGHMRTFAEVKGLKFAAAADAVPDAVRAIAEAYDVEPFNDGQALIRSGKVDAVLIATPHYFHPPLAIAALEAGVHVLVEKPIAVTAKAAAQMNEVASDHPELVYAAMFNLRPVGLWQLVKKTIDDGRVGELRRVNWTITTWFRTQAYYDSGSWRATWEGEGGGVLLNQCPHNLDLFQWFVGLPKQVTAQVGLGRHHRIEVEDEVTAMMEFENGATGTFITSTAETPGVNRLEIVGDKATIIAEAGKPMALIENSLPTSEAIFDRVRGMGVPPVTHSTIVPPELPGMGGHQMITQNFINAIREGEPLIAPAEQGIRGLELGNAMLMSGLLGEPVSLPTDRDAYEAMLKELVEKSTAKV